MSATLEIRAVLKDEFEAAARRMIADLTQIGAAGTSAGASLRMGMSSALPSVEAVNESLGRNNAQLRAQIAAYKSPEGATYLAEQKRLREEVDKLTSSGEKNSMTWANIASKYYMVSQALGTVANATMAVVDATAKYDTITMRLNAFEGSAQAGAEAMEKLQKLAKQPGLGLEQASSAYAGLRALKESGSEATAIIEAIAKANASMGGGADEFGRAMAQIQQMLGKGKLMAEDINTISESIPNFRALIMDAFGTTDTKALNAKYSVQELLKGIEEAAAKLPPPGETIRNNMDNIGDAWLRLKASIGDADSIKAATGFLATFIEKLAEGNELAAKRKKIAQEMRGREGNTWSDVLFGETENEFIRHYMQEGGRTKNAALIGQTSQSGAGASYAAYMTAPKTIAEKTSAQIKAEEDAAKKIAAARDKMDDMEVERVNRRNRELVEHRVALQNKLGRSENVYKGTYIGTQSGRLYGSMGGLQWGENQMKEDKAADDKYWDDRKKTQDKIKDLDEKIIAQEKRVKDARGKVIEAETKAEQAEWEKRSQLAIHYANTLSSTMESAYADIWVNGRDVFSSLYDAFSEMVTKMALEMAAKATIFGIFSAFGGGGLLGGASSFIFGARASGGAVFPGMTYRRNEDAYGGGGEPFRPSTSGTIMPNRSSTGSGSGGGDVHYHFAAGTTRADAGYIVRAIQQGTKERRRTVSRAI